MSAPRELVRRACDTYEAYFALGNGCADEEHLRFVRNPGAPNVYDANHIAKVSAATPEEIERVLARSAEQFV